MAAAAWRLIFSRDGTVLAATDGAPASWVGGRLQDRVDVPEDVREAGRVAVRRALHSASVVEESTTPPSLQHDLRLTVVDALPIRRAPTDLASLLRSSLDALQRQARAFDVTLNVLVDKSVPASVSLDGEKIAWATAMLVGNALRYVHHGSKTMPGGSITVRATYDSYGPDITIEVQDDGAGIPADKLRLLFGAGADQPRVGLGLSMVRDVVAAHAGHLEVQSDTDPVRSGTTVRLTLPV
jgi:signal transduction histidine kinase